MYLRWTKRVIFILRQNSSLTGRKLYTLVAEFTEILWLHGFKTKAGLHKDDGKIQHTQATQKAHSVLCFSSLSKAKSNQWKTGAVSQLTVFSSHVCLCEAGLGGPLRSYHLLRRKESELLSTHRVNVQRSVKTVWCLDLIQVYYLSPLQPQLASPSDRLYAFMHTLISDDDMRGRRPD